MRLVVGNFNLGINEVCAILLHLARKHCKEWANGAETDGL
jgi:hypothetical protein